MRRSPNRVVAVIVGVVFVLLGTAGFFVTSGTTFFDLDGALLFEFFSVNIAQNVLHIVIGAALILAGVSSTAAARTVNGVVGVLFLALGIFGLFVVPGDINVFALNGADNVAHLGGSVLLLAVGLGAERRTKPGT